MLDTPTPHSLGLFPYPRRFSAHSGQLQLSAATVAAIGKSRLTTRQLPGMRIDHDAALAPEGYRLAINTGGTEIVAGDAAGRFWAIQTLRQMVAGAADSTAGPQKVTLPCVEIEDRPDFANRGFMLDISRDRVPTIATIEMLIDLCALLKMNQMQLYCEHVFAYRGHEAVWGDSSAYNITEMQHIISYAAERGVTMVANQNSYGHLEHWLRVYKHLAECPDGFSDPWGQFRPEPSTLCPTMSESLDLIADLYGQYFPLFPAEIVNIGGDEPWEHCACRSADVCREQGKGRVYLDFILKLRELAARHGKRVQLWGDIIGKYPELIPELPSDMILMEWGYEADHPFDANCARFREAGLPFGVCPGVSAWNSLGGRWPNARENLRNAARNGRKHGATDYLITEWGDNGHRQQLPILLPGLVYGAALAWNGRHADSEPEADIARWLDRHVFAQHGLGAQLVRIGELPQRHGLDLTNASLPAIITIDHFYPYYRENYSDFRSYDWQPIRSELAEISAALATDTAGYSEQAKLWRDELALTCSMLQQACDFSAAFLQTDDFDTAAIAPPQRTHLQEQLTPIIAEYRRLWALRCRPGGLADSVGRLLSLQRLLTGEQPPAL